SLNDPIYAAYLVDVREPLEYRVAFDDASSETYSVTVFEYPSLVRADAVLQYPVYTQLDERTIVDTRRVSAAAGTRLTWQLHLNKPVASAQLIGDNQEPIEVDVSSQTTLITATINLSETQTWKLKLVDEKGRENPNEITLRAKVLPNQEAKIQLTSGG